MAWKLLGWLGRGESKKVWVTDEANASTSWRSNHINLSPPLVRPPWCQPRWVRSLSTTPHQACTQALESAASQRKEHLFLFCLPGGGTIWNLSVWSGLCFVPKNLVCDSDSLVGALKHYYKWLVASFLCLKFLFLLLYPTISLTLPRIPFCHFGQESIVAFMLLREIQNCYQVIA